jgi:hypothetical protein
VTRYNRTRIDEVIANQSGQSVATCSCRQFKRKGHPCHHLYCILGRGPLVTDCDVKQLKWFEAYHGRGEQFTNQSKTLIKNRLPGPPVQILLMIEDARHAIENKTWFVESLGKIVVQISADADKEDDPDAYKADNDMDAQGFLNMFTNVQNMNNSENDLGGGFDPESNNGSTAAKIPYPELIPTFVSITGLVQTADDLAFVRKELNQIYSVLLSRKHTAGPAGNMVSLPEVDQRRKDKRISQWGCRRRGENRTSTSSTMNFEIRISKFEF